MTTPQTEQRELKAGRELDALVAVKVMGWMQIEIGGKRWANVGANHYAGAAPSNLRFVSDWRPSTDIAAAWEVVEKMHSLGFTVAVMRDTGDEEPSCEIAKPEWQGSEVWSGKTAPLAICLAALKAVQS